jgi:NAD(P)-dependent dehydrogenase (short-subunit alcohol dehydrogenase family)
LPKSEVRSVCTILIKVRVNSISPGWIDVTGLQKTSSGTSPAHLTNADHDQHPVGRVGVATDISKACMFLSGDQSSFMTGQNITVDGGMTIKMIYHEDEKK